MNYFNECTLVLSIIVYTILMVCLVAYVCKIYYTRKLNSTYKIYRCMFTNHTYVYPYYANFDEFELHYELLMLSDIVIDKNKKVIKSRYR